MDLQQSPGVQDRRRVIPQHLRGRNATTDQLARRFFAGRTSKPETWRQQASRWVGKQLKRKLIHVAGAVTLRSTGRPAIVYGARSPPELLEHQVWLTELELILGVEFDREARAGRGRGVGEKDRESSAE